MRGWLMRPVRCIVAVVAAVIVAGVFRSTPVAVRLGERGMAIAMMLSGRTRMRLRMRMLASGAGMRMQGTGTSV